MIVDVTQAPPPSRPTNALPDRTIAQPWGPQALLVVCLALGVAVGWFWKRR